MKTFIVAFRFALLLVPCLAQAQTGTPESTLSLPVLEMKMAYQGERMVNDSLPEHRQAAADTLYALALAALQQPNSFDYPFEAVERVSILTPQDKALRVFTWQLWLNDSTYRYYGILQLNDKKGTVVPLQDASETVSNPEMTKGSAARWYGALYYNIRQFSSKGETYYLLFGFDAFTAIEQRKVLEIMSIQKGKPVFGAPLFDLKNAMGKARTVNRYVMQYSDGVAIRLNYDETVGGIILDHLIPFGLEGGGEPVLVPDGSYDALKLQKGRWVLEEMIYKETFDTPPMPQPILDKKRRGLFGEGR